MKYKWINDLLVLTIKNEVCRLLFAASRVYFSSSGLIHTRHFCTQYCDKKIKIYWDKNIFLNHGFQWLTKVSS